MQKVSFDQFDFIPRKINDWYIKLQSSERVGGEGEEGGGGGEEEEADSCWWCQETDQRQGASQGPGEELVFRGGCEVGWRGQREETEIRGSKKEETEWTKVNFSSQINVYSNLNNISMNLDWELKI